jgi:hypothetical protein
MRTEISQAHHVKLIASGMRARDVTEVRAGWGEPQVAIEAALAGSFYARTLFHDLKPICMYGLAPLVLLSGCAQLWIFATAAIDEHPIAFARASKLALAELFKRCSLLTNLIDINDAPAMRWMHWLGGECVLPHQERGGRLFAQFIMVDEMERKRACRQA